jgi:hypothetical protein
MCSTGVVGIFAKVTLRPSAAIMFDRSVSGDEVSS